METQYLSLLPEQGEALVKEIESFAGTQIHVLPNPTPISPTDPNPNAPACMVNENEAIIYVGRLDDQTARGLVHELLHIRRYWNQAIPQLLPKGNSPDNLKVTSAIENAIEHLVIVPEEENFGFGTSTYWNNTARGNWASYPWPNISSAFARRKNCLLGWLTIKNLVTDNEVIAMATKAVEQEGLFAEAELFNDRIMERLSDKVDCIISTIRFLKIPRDEVSVVYFDPIKKERCVLDLAEH